MWKITGAVCYYWPSRPRLQQSGKSDFWLSLSGDCVVQRTSSLSKRYCYGGLIVVGHKSSFDQLTFTYWKRPMQLSKQFFHCVAIYFSFTVCVSVIPLPPPLSLSLSLHFFRLISPFLYIFVTFMCASKYIYYSFSLTVCSYFFVFFRVRPLSLYVSLSLSVHLSDSLYLSFYVFVLCLFSINFCLSPSLSFFKSWSYEIWSILYLYISVYVRKLLTVSL